MAERELIRFAPRSSVRPNEIQQNVSSPTLFPFHQGQGFVLKSNTSIRGTSFNIKKFYRNLIRLSCGIHPILIFHWNLEPEKIKVKVSSNKVAVSVRLRRSFCTIFVIFLLICSAHDDLFCSEKTRWRINLMDDGNVKWKIMCQHDRIRNSDVSNAIICPLNVPSFWFLVCLRAGEYFQAPQPYLTFTFHTSLVIFWVGVFIFFIILQCHFVWCLLIFY